MRLYHYTNIESFKKIWNSKKLLFSTYRNTNDMFERMKAWRLISGIVPSDGDNSSISAVWESFGKKFSDILKNYKQISLTMDYKTEPGYASPMMWGQYARDDEGNGVCMELDSEKLKLTNKMNADKIKYMDRMPLITFNDPNVYMDEKYLKKYVETNIDQIFFTKHIHWEHENEYRIVSETEKALSISDAIERVYIFSRHDDNAKIVDNTIRGEVPIRFICYSHDGQYIKIENASYDYFKNL